MGVLRDHHYYDTDMMERPDGVVYAYDCVFRRDYQSDIDIDIDMISSFHFSHLSRFWQIPCSHRRNPKCHLTRLLESRRHNNFRIKKKLAKKMRQNRPIMHWFCLRKNNMIRYNAKRRHWHHTKLGF
ncbi:uncharacterized protein LOC127150730 [Cucumis melo]|uniref:Uncharacterized protein LOC127150730 n=1 Tax=Cucumis melo TaxID=3656 RepID=A0ABM3L5A0_CUCME|nr:uncharacterized protein LOC127150730 [Cucumis melo]